MAHGLVKKEKNSSGSRQFTSGDAHVYQFIHRLKPIAKRLGQNYTVSELHRCITCSGVKNTISYREK